MLLVLGSMAPLTSATADAMAASGPTSIVQLGDSIASGEGTLYGFTFDTKTGKWQGPADAKPKWEGDYQDCHESKDAYGQVLAGTFPKASFTQLACTGSTFDHGIAGPWSNAVPAQFGNWATRTELNARYTAAKPDLVLVTLGADDVQFSQIVTQCAEYVYYHPFAATQCTAQTPNGPDDVIAKDFTNYLPTLNQNLTTLISWIEERSTLLGSPHSTQIVFTTYPDPLPSDAPAGGKNYCPDSWLFYNDQLTYLSSLVHVMDNDIVQTIRSYASANNLANVTVVDLQNLDDGHQWCAKEAHKGTYVAPWAYGFSIYHHYSDLIDPNPAAFHPTPAGQRAIAEALEPTIKHLFPKSA
jgi:lysophospholipase L1-like esterase